MKILEEYGKYYIDFFDRLLQLDVIYIALIVLLLVLFNILLSITTKKVLEKMNQKVNSAIWVPLINVLYFLGVSIHSLMSIIFMIIIVLILPIPHYSHGVLTISSIVSNKMAHILYVALVLEIVVGLICLIIKYIRYDKSIRIVR